MISGSVKPYHLVFDVAHLAILAEVDLEEGDLDRLHPAALEAAESNGEAWPLTFHAAIGSAG